MASKARGAKKPLISNSMILGLLAVCLAAAMLIHGVQSLGTPQSAVAWLVAVSAAAALGAMVWWSGRWRRRLNRSLDRHADQLVGVYLRTRLHDAFGYEDSSAWEKQVGQFLRKVVFSRMSDAKFRQLRRSREFDRLTSKVTNFSRRLAEVRRASDPSVHADAALFSPDEYETHCARILEDDGWAAQATPRTRDSGADIIATKGAWRVAVECKRYSKPVGNRAVQQVNAAKTLYSANSACVVAPCGFTRQAQQEAHGLGVLLLHHSDLPRLAKLLGSRAGMAVA